MTRPKRENEASNLDEIIVGIVGRVKPRNNDASRPWITLSYAQSLDGSIALGQGEQTFLSGEAASKLTHGLRAAHDGILVGRRTVEADNPRLTARSENGDKLSRQPTPVVLDSALSIPDDCHLLTSSECVRPILVAVQGLAKEDRIRDLTSRGCRVVLCRGEPNNSGGIQVDLDEALELLLVEHGIRTLMVEGGARVIYQFLQRSAVDVLVLTVAPVLIGGLRGIADPLGSGAETDAETEKSMDLSRSTLGGHSGYPILLDHEYLRLGDDLIVVGRVHR